MNFERKELRCTSTEIGWTIMSFPQRFVPSTPSTAISIRVRHSRKRCALPVSGNQCPTALSQLCLLVTFRERITNNWLSFTRQALWLDIEIRSISSWIFMTQKHQKPNKPEFILYCRVILAKQDKFRTKWMCPKTRLWCVRFIVQILYIHVLYVGNRIVQPFWILNSLLSKFVIYDDIFILYSSSEVFISWLTQSLVFSFNWFRIVC